MAAVRLCGNRPWCQEPAAPPCHTSGYISLPPPTIAAVKKLPQCLRLPLFSWSLETRTFVRVDEALTHLAFAPDGCIAFLDLAALHHLATLVLLRRRQRTMHWQEKEIVEVKSQKYTSMVKDVRQAFDSEISLPGRAVLSTLIGRNTPESVAEKSKVGKCSVRRCGASVDHAYSSVCADHADWQLYHPIDVGKAKLEFPELGTTLLHPLLGQCKVYFERGECVTPADAERRGRIVAAGLWLDDIYKLLAGEHQYGKRCDGLFAAFGMPTSMLVQMAATTRHLHTAKRAEGNAKQLKSAVESLSTYGYAADALATTCADLATRHIGSLHAPAKLIRASYKEISYLVSAVAAVCIRRLYGTCNSFSFRVIVGRHPPEEKHTYARTIDAANPNPATLLRLRALPPDAQILVQNAEALTFGCLMAITEAYAAVTFCGSIVAASGPVELRYTGQKIGFVWHCVVQAARSSDGNGSVCTSSPALTDDVTLRPLINQRRLVIVDNAVGDPLSDLHTALVNEVAADVSSAKQIYSGLHTNQAIQLFYRHSKMLETLANLLV